MYLKTQFASHIQAWNRVPTMSGAIVGLKGNLASSRPCVAAKSVQYGVFPVDYFKQPLMFLFNASYRGVGFRHSA